MLDAERRAGRRASRAAGGREDLGPARRAIWIGREADAAARGVHEHPLAAAQLREPVERLVRGDERDGSAPPSSKVIAAGLRTTARRA